MAAPRSTADVLRGFASRLFPHLDERNYYQLLDVPRDAPASAIRAAFHRIAGELHPDRYYALPDPVARDRLETIYARICEAYRVLSAPDRRAGYDRGLGKGRLRFDFSGRDTGAPANPEDSLRDLEAKRYFRLGMAALSRRDWKGAVLQFTFAESLEPGSPLIAAKLAEAQAGGKPGSGAG